MTCGECGRDVEPGARFCPSCGAPIGPSNLPGLSGPSTISDATAKPDLSDWRERVRDTVARHKERKRREREKRDDDARQLSIFPDESFEDEEERQLRRKRAEIRARVEQRVARHRSSLSSTRRFDAGEIAISRGRAAAAAARELAREPDDDEMVAENAELASRTDAPGQRELAPFFEQEEPELEDVSEPLLALGVASAGERVFSGVIDLAFVALIQLTLFYLTTHLVAQRLGALPQSAMVAMGLVGTVLAAGYFLFFWGLSGQTLGKLLTGARVVDRKGGALGFGRAALRLLGLLLAALPLGAGFIGLWTDPERRGWHDRIAGTKVVRG